MNKMIKNIMDKNPGISEKEAINRYHIGIALMVVAVLFFIAAIGYMIVGFGLLYYLFG